MGTVISKQSLAKIQAMLSETKGHIVTGGQPMTGQSDLDGFDFARGSFFAPSVVDDIEVDDRLWTDEIFGPVVVVKRFEVHCCSRRLTLYVETVATDRGGRC